MRKKVKRVIFQVLLVIWLACISVNYVNCTFPYHFNVINCFYFFFLLLFHSSFLFFLLLQFMDWFKVKINIYRSIPVEVCGLMVVDYCNYLKKICREKKNDVCMEIKAIGWEMEKEMKMKKKNSVKFCADIFYFIF